MNAPAPRLLNIGAKSGAWLRQVGLRTHEDLAAIGSLEAYLRVKRAGFKPSLNLLYALEGALMGCHWQQVDATRRSELATQAQAAVALLPKGRRTPPPGEVTTTLGESAPARDDAHEGDAPAALSF